MQQKRVLKILEEARELENEARGLEAEFQPNSEAKALGGGSCSNCNSADAKGDDEDDDINGGDDEFFFEG